MRNKHIANQLKPIELFKDALLLLLLCSAFFLLWEAQLLVGLTSPLSSDEDNQQSQVQVYQIQAEAARPVRMAAITGENTMFTVQYDNEAVDALFQQSSNLLREALGSLDTPVAITRSQWQSMLSTAPGLYFDMLGDIPLSVLSGWLSGQESPSLTATPRHLLLTTYQGMVALCYQVGENEFYCATTQVVDSQRLYSLVETCTANNGLFAFQKEGYSSIDPYTMLSNVTPSPSVYLSENPITTLESRTQLLSILGLDDNASSIYTTTDGQGIVLRHDTDTLRIFGSGIVTYQGEAGRSRYPISSTHTMPSTFEVVEHCRSLAASAILPFCGDGRLHLLSIQQDEARWTVNFGYTLDGAPVEFSDGAEGAQFIVENGEIIEFTLRLRQYTRTEERTILLPQLQAVAAMDALGYYRQELMLSYYDDSASSVSADWAATTH